ncbi:MAG: hypothetical protein H7281_03165 [Bacteriovorax sp.]|nr:hypothetical protein [Bacteriovorax sp.]
MKVIFTFLVLVITSFQVMAIEATHGMVIFGKETLYAYHLPMFHKIHNKQMVFTFDVPLEIKEQISKIQDTQFLTFVPAPFDLDKFIAHPFELKGDLYSGHFEKNGVVVLEGITISNPKIIYLNQISKGVERNEEYKLFGSKNDAYALHLINGSTAIDQIFKIVPTDVSDANIDYVINSKSIFNFSLLELNNEYTIFTQAGRCPSRLCGEPGQKLATFKIESLYFEDQVM